GSLTADDLEEEGLGIYVTAPSAHPEVSDDENISLQRTANDILDALLLQGVPRIGRGLVANGANVDGEIRMRSYTPLTRHYLTDGRPPFIVGMNEIRRSITLARRLRYILNEWESNRSLGQWSRLIRGLRTLLSANRQENSVGERLHQFVRAVEAIIKPKIGDS